MLQPLQLTDVSVRYTQEIAELRDFLIKADCALGASETLADIATRLSHDRAFRRDLTSYVWVVLDRRGRQISFSDLLGILALAAAGKNFAAVANEDDAHYLLRFLMEARRSFDTVPEVVEAAPIPPTSEPAVGLSTGAFRPAASDEREVFVEPVPISQSGLLSLKVPQDTMGRFRRVHWVAAAFVIAALSIGLSLKLRSVADIRNTPTSVTPSIEGTVASTSSTERTVSPSTVRPTETIGITPHPPTVLQNSRVRSFRPTTRHSRQTAAAASGIPERATNVPPQPAATATRGPVSVEPSTLAPRASRTASTAAVGPPVAALSGRLGAQPPSVDSSEPGANGTARSSKPPILLRRRSSPSGLLEDGGNLISEVRPADISPALGPNRIGSVDAARGGVVHVTSLGTMAANIVYSPMPTYPPAASASHVQGEVKISAEVDRAGNVASVRVISGPPLLRDAALDAVQRWHYRPYMSSGQPTPTTAIAIMDFQLP